MANHYVALHSDDESRRLLAFLNGAYPLDKVPFSITVTQDQPQTGQGSSDGEEDQTIQIKVGGIGANAAHTIHYSASPVQYSKTHDGDPNSTFLAARVAIDEAVEAWWETERNKQTLPPESSTR
jgi:hypothetical protein